MLFRPSSPFAKTHLEEVATAGMSRAEAVCYARTWNSQCWCRFKPPNSGGFQCSVQPHEVFDKERKMLRFGDTIPQMWIALGGQRGLPGLYWGWSDKPWIWED